MNEHEQKMQGIMKQINTRVMHSDVTLGSGELYLTAKDNTMTEIIEYLCPGQTPNWKEDKVFIPLGKEGEEKNVRLLRSVDLQYGEILVSEVW